MIANQTLAASLMRFSTLPQVSLRIPISTQVPHCAFLNAKLEHDLSQRQPEGGGGGLDKDTVLLQVN